MHSAAAVAAAAAVRHRVPDGHFCCHLIESDPSVSFHFIQTRLVLMAHLLAVQLLRRIYGLY